jgi:hypothetical protein
VYKWIDGVQVRYGDAEPQRTRGIETGHTRHPSRPREPNTGRGEDTRKDALKMKKQLAKEPAPVSSTSTSASTSAGNRLATSRKKLTLSATTKKRGLAQPEQHDEARRERMRQSQTANDSPPPGYRMLLDSNRQLIGSRWSQNSCAFDSAVEVLYAAYMSNRAAWDELHPNTPVDSPVRYLVEYLQHRYDLTVADGDNSVPDASVRTTIQTLRETLQYDLSHLKGWTEFEIDRECDPTVNFSILLLP